MQQFAMFKGLTAALLLLLFFFVDAIDCRGARGQKKAVVKTIKEENGDIFDCIDINKQPALKNPLLKNHIVKRRPMSYPHFQNNQELPRSISHAHVSKIMCPDGTTPIRRTKNHGLMENISFPFFRANQFTMNPLQSNTTKRVIYYATRGTSIGSYYGGRVSLSIHEVEGIKPDQISAAIVAITDRFNLGAQSDGISAGWVVSHQFYGDNKPRLTGLQNKGCYNTQCQGFVQVSSNIGLGIPFTNVSTYKGEQFWVTITIYKEPTSKNWWLLFGDGHDAIGYWPSSLFTTITDSAGQVITGGMADSPEGESSPSLGSGHFPEEGFKGAAFARRILIVNQDASVVKPTTFFTGYSAETPDCYKIGELDDNGKDDIGLNFYYGGPGKCYHL